jgi:hypothetical protein
VLQFVIPAKSRETGREPWFDRLTTLSEVKGNPELFEITSYSWIPDLASLHSARPE